MHWLFEQADWQTPGLTLQVSWRPEVAIHELPGGAAVVSHVWGALRMEGISPAILASLRRLASGWVERSELWSMVAAAGEESPADLAASLSRHGWMLDELVFLCRFRLALDGRPLLTIEPLAADARFDFGVALSPRNSPLLSRFAYLQRHSEGLSMESAAASHRAILHDAWGASLCGALAGASADDSIAGGEARLIAVRLLEAAGMLEGSERAGTAGVGAELLQMGEFHDLLFHRRSRYGRHDSAFGAEFPFLQSLDSPPALPPRIGETAIALSLPNANGSAAALLSDVLERRVSVRQYDAGPVTLERLGEFLFRAARTRGRYGPAPAAGMPYQACDRPYPSGGGIHDLELYLIVGNVQGLRPGAYHYAADRHELELLPAEAQDASSLLKGAMRASGAPEPPPVLIKIASRFARMSWKYRAISYATTLKNVGVLYQTLYLVATATGLAGCALGSGDDAAAEQVLGLAARGELAVGEFMLGNPPAVPLPGRQADPTWTPLMQAPG